MRTLELLAPARDAEVARQAILHGADAVYMGASSHGARKSAANSIDDIRRTVDFAHQFRARIYVTVNTIVYEHELKSVEKLITDLYRAGVDAVIVQDMGILRLDIPPIALHASTQCDTRTLAKARFLQDVGFSQIVLARELTLSEIRNICGALEVPVEVFVHGALCVSYSGRCHASQYLRGRSANRGECAQICRLPFDLIDSARNTLTCGRHLLSLKDLNASSSLEALIGAGVSSFKIEGRLKDAAYVKNVTAWYSRELDRIISASGGELRRSSFGRSQTSFDPDLNKSFNRSFTHYFLDARRPSAAISNPLTPKSMGEPVDDRRLLNRGDGISWIDTRSGEYKGALVNNINPDGTLFTSDGSRLPLGQQVFRTADLRFDKILDRESATRTIGVDISIGCSGVTASDERGVKVRLPLGFALNQQASKPQDHTASFMKLGGTIYSPSAVKSEIPADRFIPLSHLTALRRQLLSALDAANTDTYTFDYRRSEKLDVKFERDSLDYRDNVANSLARKFYTDHGVNTFEQAMEVSAASRRPHKSERGELTLMTARHCILRDMGKCLRTVAGKDMKDRLPLTLRHGNETLRLQFDCDRCEMRVMADTGSSLRISTERKRQTASMKKR